MSIAKNVDPQAPPTAIIPPNDLWSDEPPLETPLHLEQIILLLTCLNWWWRGRSDFFASGNISIYYEKRQLEQKSHKFRGPDFFVVLDTQPRERKSWVVWAENNRFPNLIIEILSSKTAKTDKTTKKTLYQDTFKTPEYFWFHPYKLQFAGFRLVEEQYQPIPPNEQGWRWSEQLGLFLGVHERKLRFFTAQGELVPIPEEAALNEQQQRELIEQRLVVEQQQRELAQQQAEAERQQRELAQQLAEAERQQREELEALLARYRERFGDLPDEQ